MVLADQFKELLDNIAESLPAETAEIMGRVMQKLQKSEITDNSCREGDIAPGFELPNAIGEMVSSSTLLQQGPLVLNFYRGSW
jgi:hypothetical protein